MLEENQPQKKSLYNNFFHFLHTKTYDLSFESSRKCQGYFPFIPFQDILDAHTLYKLLNLTQKYLNMFAGTTMTTSTEGKG